MSSEPPPNDSQSNSLPISSPPLIRTNLNNTRVVSQSQDRAVSQSQNVFSPNYQIVHRVELDHFVNVNF